jgi:hypothetical protein
MNKLFGLALGSALLWSAPSFAAGIENPAPEPPRIVLAADAVGGVSMNEILRMEPGHLLALGAGVIGGAALISPYLGIGELIGVAIGVIASEFTYRSGLWPFKKSANWL